MANDVRQGVLRQARASTGVEGQDTRTAGNRSAHTSRGSFINYYDDLGISTTAEKARNIRTEEADFQSRLSKQQGIISEYEKNLQEGYSSGKSQLDAARGEIGSFENMVNKSWKETKSSWIPVTLVDENNKEEQTYYLPKEAAAKIAEEDGLWTNWNPEGNHFYVSTKVKGGRYRGQELHEALGGAEKEIYNKHLEEPY